MSLKSFSRYAFTLVEMLVVIAIISILAAMAISQFSNAAQDSREIIARQQLAVVQEAASNWAAKSVGRVTAAGGLPSTVEGVRTSYNAANTVALRYAVFRDYLEESTRDSITVDAAKSRLTTDALSQTGTYLTLPDWAVGSYPKVQLNP